MIAITCSKDSKNDGSYRSTCHKVANGGGKFAPVTSFVAALIGISFHWLGLRKRRNSIRLIHDQSSLCKVRIVVAIVVVGLVDCALFLVVVASIRVVTRRRTIAETECLYSVSPGFRLSLPPRPCEDWGWHFW